MIEYEYSFKVKNIIPFLHYCEKKEYVLKHFNYQIRELYKNKSGILARITTEIENEMETKLLDFKEDTDITKVKKMAKETIPLEITESNQDFVLSLLEMFEFQKFKTLKRKRHTYQKDQVIFEIDEYSEPETCYVVAVEGEKECVDKVYLEIKNLGNE